MKIEVNLEEGSVNEWGESIGAIIRQEMDAAVRSAVRKEINAILKGQLASWRKTLEAQLSKTTPAKLAAMLEVLDKK